MYVYVFVYADIYYYNFDCKKIIERFENKIKNIFFLKNELKLNREQYEVISFFYLVNKCYN